MPCQSQNRKLWIQSLRINIWRYSKKYSRPYSVNDIAEGLSNSIVLHQFADDVELACVIRSIADVRAFQSGINKLLVWCDKNRTDKNSTGTNVIPSLSSLIEDFINTTCSLGGHDIKREEEIRDLGCTVDRKFTLAGYIKQSDDIESVQKQFVMHTLGDCNRVPPQSAALRREIRCKELGLDMLVDRRNEENLMFDYDRYNNRIDDVNLSKKLIWIDPNHPLRHNRQVSLGENI